MKLIVGLGNPGKEYELTRHNIGFMALDLVADYYNVSFDKEKMQGLYACFELNGEKIILLKPQTYINLSGEAVSKFVNFFKIDISDILVISDDMDLEVGKCKLRYKGSSGGHNGLKNIEQHLHTQEYKRVKFGISRNSFYDVKDYVLGKFSSDDLKVVCESLSVMPQIIEDFVSLSFDNVMNKYNKK